MRGWILLLVLPAVLGCGADVPPNANNAEQPAGDNPPNEADAQRVAGDADLEKVREWLRQNLDSADFQEVRWWPARPMKYCPSEEVSYQRQQATMVFLSKQEYQKQIAGMERDLETLTKTPENIISRDREYWQTKIEKERKRLSQMKAALPQTDDAIERQEQHLQSLLDQTPVPLGCRLKYRSRNKQGAFELQDQVFIIDNHKALPCLFQNEVLRFGKDFPED